MGRKGVIWRLAGAPSGVRFKTNNWKSKQNYFLNVPPPYWSKTYLGRKYIFAKKELIFSRFFASILPNFVWDFFWLTARKKKEKDLEFFHILSTRWKCIQVTTFARITICYTYENIFCLLIHSWYQQNDDLPLPRYQCDQIGRILNVLGGRHTIDQMARWQKEKWRLTEKIFN